MKRLPAGVAVAAFAPAQTYRFKAPARALAVLAVLAGVAALAPAAHADHVAPSVTATLTLGRAVKDCNTEGVCARGRRATITWNASCGPAAPPDALREVDVGIYGVRPGGATFPYAGEAVEEPTPTGSMGMTAGPGLRFFGEVTVTCRATVVNEEGHEVEHTATASSGRTQQYFLPPQLISARTTRSGFCGVTPPAGKMDRLFQAGQYAEVAYVLGYSGASLMRPGVPGLRQIKLFARGDRRLKSAPDRGMLRELGAIGRWVNPRRAGTMRLWATIGGHRTNTLRMRILPKRC
jgi:hypothetical protein